MQGRKMHLLETLCIRLADESKRFCRVSTLVPFSSACAALTPRMSRLPVLGMLSHPFSSILGKPPGYLPHESMNVTADFLEKFPGMARMANRLDSSSFLDSRSSSPEDSETSGFSSGSDHLCDMLVRHIISCYSTTLNGFIFHPRIQLGFPDMHIHEGFGLNNTS